MKVSNPDWTERYRPKKIDDVVLPERLKTIFKSHVENGDIPTLLLYGKSGIGKTTIAGAMMDELGCDWIKINSSLEGTIDTLRNKIADFAGSVSFSGGRKMVLLDEADNLNAQSTQPALRAFMETMSSNCGFILTCNYEKKIMPELKSRCTVIPMNIKKSEKGKIAMGYLDALMKILDAEGVGYDKKVLAEIITNFFPDFRRVVHECQFYSTKNGLIDAGILGLTVDADFKGLIDLMKSKDFRNVTKWIAENYDIDPLVVMRKFYDSSYDLLSPKCIPEIVVALAEYQYKHAFVSDPEVNLAACLAELMARAVWK
jgi:DNA polymerase III delta prime subunit